MHIIPHFLQNASALYSALLRFFRNRGFADKSVTSFARVLKNAWRPLRVAILRTADLCGSVHVRRNAPDGVFLRRTPCRNKSGRGLFPFSLAGSPCPCRALQKGCATQAASPLCQTTPHRVLNRFRQRTRPPCRAHECRVLNPQSVNTAFCRSSCCAPPCRALLEGIFLAKSK